MPTTNSKGPAPFSLRLTQQERARLERRAAGMPLGAYIRERLLAEEGEPQPPRRTRGKFPVKDHQALASLLALLGKSRLANNVNQLARAANSGSLPLDFETREALLNASYEIGAMKRMLMIALGVQER